MKIPFNRQYSSEFFNNSMSLIIKIIIDRQIYLVHVPFSNIKLAYNLLQNQGPGLRLVKAYFHIHNRPNKSLVTCKPKKYLMIFAIPFNASCIPSNKISFLEDE